MSWYYYRILLAASHTSGSRHVVNRKVMLYMQFQYKNVG